MKKINISSMIYSPILRSFFSIIILMTIGICQLDGHTLIYSSYLDRIDQSVSAALEIEDPLRNDPVGSPISYVVTRHIQMSLVYGREERTDVTGNYWSYKILYDLYEDGATTPLSNGELIISHKDAGGVYEALNRHAATTGKMNIVITGIEASTDEFSTTITDPIAIADLVPEDIRLEMRMEVERFDYMSEFSTVSVFHEYDVSNHDLEVRWSFRPGAEEYHLEWAYIDEEAIVAPTTNAAIFENASRVTVKGQYYNISITYPEGKIYYRVRPVARFIRNVNNDYSHLKYGNWKYANGPIQINDFDPDRNWQYTTTFAEDGTHKKAISYFDDGLRTRQTQISLSTDSLNMVATAHYDVEGRRTVDILPVPSIGNNDLFYKPKFNRATDEDSYNRAHFDKNFANQCLTTAPDPLSDTKFNSLGGAGYYFSTAYAEDAGAEGLHKGYIPDAEGFPMTQNRYMNDGTGRLALKSGVGPFYQLGSGQETKYFYDDASSAQLRRLFGSNVGDAKYYKRDIVMDANGQMSVSYVDAAGRIIATALTGVPPDNVIDLESASTSAYRITEDLTDNTVDDPQQGVSTTVTTVMNEIASNPVDFFYDLFGKNETLDLPDPDGDICVSCDYEVRIRAEDPCGAPVLLNYAGGTTLEIEQTFSGTNICTTDTYDPPGNGLAFSITMTEIGLYKIIKELRVLDKGIEEWQIILEDYLPDSIDFVNATVIDYYSCYVTCDQMCRFEIIEQNGNPNYEPTQAEIDACIASKPQCDLSGVFDTYSDSQCDFILHQIYNQIAPDGCLYEQTPAWWTGLIPASEQFTLDDGITRDFSDPLTQAALIDPTQWQESWMTVLAPYHPEYCHYVLCDKSDENREFNYDLTQAEGTFNNGNWDGSITSLGFGDVQDLLDNDPMFSTTNGFYPNFNQHGLTSAQESAILGALNTVLGSSSNIATNLKTELTNRLTSFGLCPNQTSANLAGFINCSFPDQTDEFRWNVMKSLYQGAKLKLRNEIRREWCVTQTGDCAIVQDSELFDFEEPNPPNGDNTSEQGDDYIAENNVNMCGITCEMRVEEWVTEITIVCPNVNETAIRSALLDYCLGSCGAANPLAYLLEEEILNGGAIIDPNLSIVASEINSAGCGSTGLEVISDLVVAFDLVYEYLVDENGVQICEEIQTFDACFLAALEAISDHILQPGLCTGTGTIIYNPNPPLSCFTSIQIYQGGNGGNPYITINGGVTCCQNFYLMDGTTFLNPCDYDWMSSPWIDNDEIFVRLIQTGVDTIDAMIDCFVPFGNFSGEELIAPEDVPCSTVETLCIVIPKDSINIDSIFQECVDILIAESIFEAEILWTESYNTYIENIINQRKCLEGYEETFRMSYDTREHYYTLYYYDQPGNLIQTVPPGGIDQNFLTTGVDLTTGIWNGQDPNHSQRSKYQFNTLGQVVWQYNPDGGATDFKYDYAQRLRVSQNDEQDDDGYYSYMKFDEQGRIVEAGELQSPGTAFGLVTESDLNDFGFPDAGDGVKKDVISTDYNLPSSIDNDFPQENLHGRVAMTDNENITTRYTYDEHGNVSAIQHKVNAMSGLKQRIDYEYDLISGSVLGLAYQAGEADEFYHRYNYDADNRLTYVYTSDDNIIWDRDARYFYYMHGPLARMEIGHDNVQGMDYYYTLQGWIKGTNMPGFESYRLDPGQDGWDVLDKWVARDEFTYALGYHEQDYDPIDQNVLLGATGNFSSWNSFAADLSGPAGSLGMYNGHISWMMTGLPVFDQSESGQEGLRGMVYQYDQLNRIKQAKSYGVSSSLSDGSVAWNNDNWYNTAYTYNPNGNIKSLQRNAPLAGSSGLLDNLTYEHNPSRPNRLDYITEGVTTNFPDDPSITNQTSTSNYEYDGIGNLTSDEAEGVSSIDWTIYGKVKEVKFSNGQPTVSYTYDPAGNRLSKHALYAADDERTTFYLRDANGKLLSIYERTVGITGVPVFKQKEVPLYGSSRIGQQKFSDRIIETNVASQSSLYSVHLRERGGKLYEQSNHLGNVLVTVSDQKRGEELVGLGDDRADYYEAITLSAQDYYPFGWEMPGLERNLSSSNKYRYGFNGKEKDEEGEFGSITNYDYGFRIYNPGIGRFLSIDPLAKNYPMLTPYQFASNKPIDGIDLDGLEYVTYVVNWYEGQSEPEINITFHDIAQNNTYGKQGPGVYYGVNHWKVASNGMRTLDKEKSVSFFHERSQGVTQYGLYYGADALYKISKEGTLTDEYDYSIPPIDAVDYGAWIHDKGYDAVDAAGSSGLLSDWATTPADLNAIIAWQVVIDRGVGGTDPYNYQDITQRQVTAADRGINGIMGISGFARIADKKKRKIADFMADQQDEVAGVRAKKAEDWIENNYQIFVDTYFDIDEGGFHVKKNGYWEVGEDGEPVSGGDPIPVSEVDIRP